MCHISFYLSWKLYLHIAWPCCNTALLNVRLYVDIFCVSVQTKYNWMHLKKTQISMKSITKENTKSCNKLSFFAKSRLFVDTLFSSYTNFLVMFDINFALSVISGNMTFLKYSENFRNFYFLETIWFWFWGIFWNFLTCTVKINKFVA